MDPKVRNAVGIMLIIGIPLYVGATLFSAYYERAVSPSSFREFSVTADGFADVNPDIATLQISVLSEGGTKISDLQKTNTEKMNKIIEFIKSKGVAEIDIKTANYSISPRYQHFDCSTPVVLPAIDLPDGSVERLNLAPEVPQPTKVCPPPKIVGYSINQSASVKVRDFDVIGDILTGATTEGANSVSGPNFGIDDLSVYQKEAREQAMSRAKEKAQDLANNGGFKLGRLISLSEYATNAPYSNIGYGKGGMMEASVSSAPQIEAGTQRVSVEINIRYEIK